MKFSIRDFERIKNLQQNQVIPVMKAEPIREVDPHVISQRAFEVARLGLMMFKSGNMSTAIGPFNSSLPESFKQRVREYAVGIRDKQLFKKAVALNVFLDSEDPYYRQHISQLVEDALA